MDGDEDVESVAREVESFWIGWKRAGKEGNAVLVERLVRGTGVGEYQALVFQDRAGAENRGDDRRDRLGVDEGCVVEGCQLGSVANVQPVGSSGGNLVEREGRRRGRGRNGGGGGGVHTQLVRNTKVSQPVRHHCFDVD